MQIAVVRSVTGAAGRARRRDVAVSIPRARRGDSPRRERRPATCYTHYRFKCFETGFKADLEGTASAPIANLWTHFCVAGARTTDSFYEFSEYSTRMLKTIKITTEFYKDLYSFKTQSRREPQVQKVNISALQRFICQKISTKRKNGKSSGPDGIPSAAIKLGEQPCLSFALFREGAVLEWAMRIEREEERRRGRRGREGAAAVQLLADSASSAERSTAPRAALEIVPLLRTRHWDTCA
ncbi:hypothetical protein EVAR_69432_1 [Eumeta japonica]|uniref:Uncharacterized protein n=1 Tax=Eumeta variegata TaxID=151549 RepID=A0A4C2A870_EUMVA|nr:hypothetical protein EVAR_69432_1 [Eumeta japonica]